MAKEDVALSDKLDDESIPEPVPPLRRSTRVRRAPELLKPSMAQIENQNNINFQSPIRDEDVYSVEMAPLIAQFIVKCNGEATRLETSNGMQYVLQKGLKVFGEKGREAAIKEVKQMLQRTCFVPISVKELTPEERRRTVEAILLLTEKRDGSNKGRLVYNGKPSREWIRDDTASPTAILEGLLLTAIIDTNEERDIMTSDVPNAFIQTEMPKVKDGEQRVTMKITGVLVDMIV